MRTGPTTRPTVVSGVSSTALGLALGYAADLMFGDPRRGHPVAIFGSAAACLERQLWADSRPSGVVFTTLAVGTPTLAATALESATRGRPVLHAGLVAVATWAALGGRSLAREGSTMAELLTGDDLPAARRRLGHLCSRDATDLGAPELARATVESLAENTSDAVVAPLLWGAVGGAAGIVAYRCLNTLDAMVGYRNARYRRFGWASARLDDVANLVPSRVTAALTVLLAPVVGGRADAAWRAWRDDAPAHPSPNAGPVEATAAGALGLRLGGANTYDDHVEHRGHLGRGRDPDVADITRTITLTRAVSALSLGVAVLAAQALAAAREQSDAGSRCGTDRRRPPALNAVVSASRAVIVLVVPAITRARPGSSRRAGGTRPRSSRWGFGADRFARSTDGQVRRG